MPNGKLEVVGYTDEKEAVSEQTLGAQRAVNIKYHLTTDESTTDARSIPDCRRAREEDQERRRADAASRHRTPLRLGAITSVMQSSRVWPFCHPDLREPS